MDAVEKIAGRTSLRFAAALAVVALAFSATGVLGAGRETVISRIERRPVASSALASIGYSKRLRALEIEFRNGAIYRYINIPPEIYRDLMSASSKAQFYDDNIRGHFRSIHVKPPRRR